MTSTKCDKLLDFLAEVPFFSEVERTSLSQLCKSSEMEQYIKNNRIIEKGDMGDAMYVVLEGKVKVHDRDHAYGSLAKGDCFGEYALIDEEPRSVSVTALEDTSVLKITTAHFSQLMDSDKGFVRGIMSVLIKRHRELDVTQEKLASSKKEVELANAKMMGLIDGAMDAIIMFDGNFRIILANDSAKSILENTEVSQRNVLFFWMKLELTYWRIWSNLNSPVRSKIRMRTCPGSSRLLVPMVLKHCMRVRLAAMGTKKRSFIR